MSNRRKATLSTSFDLDFLGRGCRNKPVHPRAYRYLPSSASATEPHIYLAKSPIYVGVYTLKQQSYDVLISPKERTNISTDTLGAKVATPNGMDVHDLTGFRSLAKGCSKS